VQCRAIVFEGVDQVAVREFDLRDPTDGEILVESAYTCISPGTELRCLAGRYEGAPEFPFLPGYALTGHVTRAGRDAGLAEGTPVLALGTRDAGGLGIHWGGHTSHAVLPASWAIALPRDLDLQEASLAVLGAVAFHGRRISSPEMGETTVVVGLGVLGQLSARLHMLAGARVIGCDRSPARVEIARLAGMKAVVAGDDLAASVGGLLMGGAEIVVDATGSAEVLPQAMSLLRDLPWNNVAQSPARYIVQGSFEGDFRVPYRLAFEKQVAIHVPRAQQRRDHEAVLKLLARRTLRMRDLISDVRPPEAAAETYEELRHPDPRLMTVAFDWK
jgi:2-desacetyl-2-hydroxyethyl bacteriochlorophyllide A dehydrogenase